ncbi:MAG: hypothetical protein ACRDFS_09135, partial [Chloroflexota bacterium]
RPDLPQPRLFEAMIQDYRGASAKALAELKVLERKHPSYARAWLLEGLIYSHEKGAKRETVDAWKHFLVLQPPGTVSRQVQNLLKRIERAG